MNRIVRENYPVSKLPHELQDGLSGQQRVTLIIDWSAEDPGLGEASEQTRRVKSLEELFAMAEPTFKSLEEVTAHVRLLRDEWSPHVR